MATPDSKISAPQQKILALEASLHDIVQAQQRPTFGIAYSASHLKQVQQVSTPPVEQKRSGTQVPLLPLPTVGLAVSPAVKAQQQAAKLDAAFVEATGVPTQLDSEQKVAAHELASVSHRNSTQIELLHKRAKEGDREAIDRVIELIDEMSATADKLRKPPTGLVAAPLEFLKQRFGASAVSGNTLTVSGLLKFVQVLEEESKRHGYLLPWKPHGLAIGTGSEPDSRTYSMFPITDEIAWHYYCSQETQMWSAKEIDYPRDKKQFPLLKPRYQELYYDLLGFFAPGDGLVSTNVLRFIGECKTYSEMMFLVAQLFIEAVHSEAYGMSITAIIPDEKMQQRVFRMVDELPCVQAKAAYMKKYINSAKSESHRDIAAACTERIFFVTLFAIIFAMRKKTAPDGSKGILPGFIFLNEQVAKDETLHGDFYCDRARRRGLPPREEIMEIIGEAVKVEIEHMKYILRTPIDSAEEDAAAGITIEALSAYAARLGDQVLVLLGTSTHYNVDVELEWMGDISLSKKTNFYEGKVGSYKKMGLADALDWRKRAGLTSTVEQSAVSRPDEVEF
ncbi:Ribonucleoside-diphosphate reductase small subunit [uncultured virus]|nr:Ribonucleoside-diphosphate reductase small subunit [uncultured virus]